MAGNYYHDPRPFYGLGHHNLMSMDELFYGRREAPPWYQQQQMPYGHFGDYPRSRSMEPQRPEQYIQREDQFREYRRPDMRDDVYIGHQHDMHGANKGQQKNPNQGGNNNHGNINHGNTNHGNTNHSNNSHGNNNHGDNKGKNQQKHQNDSDKEDYEKSHKGGNHGNSNKSNNNHGQNQSHNNDHGHGHNKSHNSDHGHDHNKSWSDNKGFHGGRGHGRHRRSLSLTQIVLKKLGLKGDSSSDSSDDDRHGSQHNKKGAHGRVQTKGDQKPHAVRFDDQLYGHSNQSHNKKGGGSEKLGEDHGSHGKKGGGQPQGILKTSKNKHGDDGYSSDEGHKNHGNGKGGNQHHGGGAESGKKGGQGATKQLGRAQSMDFRVNLCCENCERKVKKALWKMDVDHVLCDQWNNRVVVTGNAKPESVLKKLRSVKKDTLLWHQPK